MIDLLLGKYCTKCRFFKSWASFNKRPNSSDGLTFECKACMKCFRNGLTIEKFIGPLENSKTQNALSVDAKLYNLKVILKHRYNITVEQYEKMLEDCNHSCTICLRHESEFERRLHIDHDHECCAGTKSCGKCIRGLSCSGCNRMIGQFKEDTALLNRAILYLSK